MLFYLAFVILMVVFASQNLTNVTVYLLAGSPIQIPLILVIGMSFFIGFAFAILTVIRRAIRKPKREEGTFLQPRD
ncbi:LapA family protein [Magnetovibrio sp. PR-2]|uniref:LapA family protein n=1 Tax=Magnetovibrio sp. PR-2 TaxID=3120356 RepID=UPI002FCDE324